MQKLCCRGPSTISHLPLLHRGHRHRAVMADPLSRICGCWREASFGGQQPNSQPLPSRRVPVQLCPDVARNPCEVRTELGPQIRRNQPAGAANSSSRASRPGSGSQAQGITNGLLRLRLAPESPAYSPPLVIVALPPFAPRSGLLDHSPSLKRPGCSRRILLDASRTGHSSYPSRSPPLYHHLATRGCMALRHPWLGQLAQAHSSGDPHLDGSAL